MKPPHPMFVQVDFGLIRETTGNCTRNSSNCRPSLPSTPTRDRWPKPTSTCTDLKPESARLRYLLSGLETSSYRELLRRAIVGSQDPENVILMEIDPVHQKTLPDFLLTEKMLGVRAVDIVDIKKEGSRLYYERDGKRIPIKRIYNRAIVDELERKNVKLAFDWRDDLDVEWAGHPELVFPHQQVLHPLSEACVGAKNMVP